MNAKVKVFPFIKGEGWGRTNKVIGSMLHFMRVKWYE